jgi:hypothetical protein
MNPGYSAVLLMFAQRCHTYANPTTRSRLQRNHDNQRWDYRK